MWRYGSPAGPVFIKSSLTFFACPGAYRPHSALHHREPYSSTLSTGINPCRGRLRLAASARGGRAVNLTIPSNSTKSDANRIAPAEDCRLRIRRPCVASGRIASCRVVSCRVVWFRWCDRQAALMPYAPSRPRRAAIASLAIVFDRVSITIIRGKDYI